MQERSEAERRAIWPCLNVATWRRERSDRAIQQLFYFQGGKKCFFLLTKSFLFSAKNGYQQKLKLAIHNQVKTRRQCFFNGLSEL